MQFLPATWRAYGLGGDVHDPHDAILGAANLLRASGAPTDNRRALFAYNHSTLYVDAVLDVSCIGIREPSTPSTRGRCSCARRAGIAGSRAHRRIPPTRLHSARSGTADAARVFRGGVATQDVEP
jgi:hypothetical protein